MRTWFIAAGEETGALQEQHAAPQALGERGMRGAQLVEHGGSLRFGTLEQLENEILEALTDIYSVQSQAKSAA